MLVSGLDQDRWIADGASGTGFWRRRVQALSRPEGPERYFVPIIISARGETPASIAARSVISGTAAAAPLSLSLSLSLR